MDRRKFLGASAAAIGASVGGLRVRQAAAEASQIRIGYQKNGILVIARQRGTIEEAFGPKGIAVTWTDFASGPPMMEAMNAGHIDFGQVGDAPPIFAQAAGAAVVYAAGQPITNGQGILVPAKSEIRDIVGLKGKRIGFTKGSSAHNVVVQTLEKAGLGYQDITPVYLSPPDAGAAFANGAIDAWAVWDPYFAIGEAKQGGRILVNARDVTKTNSFYIANRDFARKEGDHLRRLIGALDTVGAWAGSNRDGVAKSLAAVTGVPLEIQTIAARRSDFRIGAMTDDIVATQQGVADRFFKLGLIPKQIAVRDAVWTPAQT